ncbi:MAG TPA: hypothetical protein VMD30_06890, partial [Tepidisphaeraceae bacterium]|nr:hypothetical protein [Tepidisphaeraceae bacterium]
DSLIDELPPVPRARPVASTAFLMGDNPPRQDAKVEEPSPLPAPAPAVNSQPSADASAQDGKPDSPADSQQEIELAMGLFANAIDAESRHDYSSAIWYYQKIEERIPKEDWPGGLEIRLEAAEKQLGQK